MRTSATPSPCRSVEDAVAPVVTLALAAQTANAGKSSVNVLVTFAVDEAPATVYWVARTTPTTDAGVVKAGATTLVSGDTLAAIPRSHKLYLVAWTRRSAPVRW